MSSSDLREDVAATLAPADDSHLPGGDAKSRRAWLPARLRHRPSGRALWLTPIVGATLLFYYWTGTTEGNAIRFGTQSDWYNRLGDAFLHGHLSLLTRPPSALLALRNPYTAWRHPQFLQYWDLALYHGHFYVTWGPTPVLTLLLPWRILHLGAMPLNLAVIIFCSAAFLCSVALLLFLVDSFLPGLRSWRLATAVVALGCSSVLPFLLRQPTTYELALASAYCFAMLAGYLLATGGLAGRFRPWRLALGSLCIGLAAGARPGVVFEGLLALALWWWVVRRDGLRRLRERAVAGSLIIGPCLVVVVLLLAYNALRFGSVFQQGYPYTLDRWDPTTPALRLSYLLPGLHNYVLSSVRWTYAFPYLTLSWHGSFAPGLPPSELTSGILATTPILFAIPIGVWLLLRRSRELAVVVIGLLGTGVLVMCFASVAVGASSMRYEADFIPFLLLAALVSWLALARLRFPWRRLCGVLGALAIVYGAVVGLAISITGYYDALRSDDPATYWDLASATSVLPTVASSVGGHPVLARVVAPIVGANGAPAATGDTGTQRIGSTRFYLSGTEIDVIAPSQTTRWLTASFDPPPGIAIVIFRNGDNSGERPLHGNVTISALVPLDRGLNRIQLLPAGTIGSGPSHEIVMSGVRLSALHPRVPASQLVILHKSFMQRHGRSAANDR